MKDLIQKLKIEIGVLNDLNDKLLNERYKNEKYEDRWYDDLFREYQAAKIRSELLLDLLNSQLF